ncbi:hypothetical protein EVAR_84601_1 [Eumeta japonica]|uniref:Uncharacterized protein n=1 Tax=Eumeta variegata TaxID=151549 RepID=A0A4C1ZGY0_EUMVA|nr:hypothetical protein EVAR_84601_1 [Eumeta japonica]
MDKFVVRHQKVHKPKEPSTSSSSQLSIGEQIQPENVISANSIPEKKGRHFRNDFRVLRFQFVSALTSIGRRLAGVADKERRNGRLRAELAALDLNLPACGCRCIGGRTTFLRIPPRTPLPF